ncbi:hypothetical protein HGRIS_013017 [Hohenbuehelia grisea]|uniref:Uncharacterized protein n=1 Tax=Hohenbuehelia grisea TaxID=104357 RepID=A0ABR3IU25_9AGAR
MKGRPSTSSRTCCMPPKVGVGVISALGGTTGLLFAVADGFIVNKYGARPAFDCCAPVSPYLQDSRFTSFSKLVVYLHGIIFTILGVISFVGLLAVFRQSKRLAIFNFSAGAAHIPFSIASGAALLHVVFRAPEAAFIPLCTAVTDETTFNDDCHQNVTIMRAVLLTVSLIVWLYQIAGAFVNNAYVKELSGRERLMDDDESFYS